MKRYDFILFYFLTQQHTLYSLLGESGLILGLCCFSDKYDFKITLKQENS